MRCIGPNITRRWLLSASAAALAFSAPLAAQTPASEAGTGTEASGEGVFTLGQITITARRVHDDPMADNVISNPQMWRFNTGTLDQAVKLVPGVSRPITVSIFAASWRMTSRRCRSAKATFRCSMGRAAWAAPLIW